MCVILESLKKNREAKKNFIVPLLVKKVVTKCMNMPLRFGINLKWKQWKIITTCTLNSEFALLADVFEKFKIMAQRIRIMFESLSECTSFKLGCNSQ